MILFHAIMKIFLPEYNDRINKILITYLVTSIGRMVSAQLRWLLGNEGIWYILHNIDVACCLFYGCKNIDSKGYIYCM